MTQTEFLEILFNELGFTPSTKRIWLESEYNVGHIDELKNFMKSSLIRRLKEMKEENR